MDTNNVKYIPKRKNPAYDIGQKSTQNILEMIYNVKYENKGAFHILKNKGGIIPPKHHYNMDIPLIGALIRESIDRRAYYLMKSSLPKVLEYFGGIPISRGKDIRMIPKEKRREALEHAKVEGEYLFNVMLPELLKKDEIIVIYPEVERTKDYRKEGTPKKKVLFKIIQMQDIMQKEVPLIPVDITYEKGKEAGGIITLKAIEPIYTSNAETLEDYLVDNIPLMVKGK